MVKRSHGPRVGTKNILSKRKSQRGKTSIGMFLKDLKEGDVVLIKPNPSIQKGLPHHRFFNKHGIVKGKRGASYILEVKDKHVKKDVICPPVHLIKVVVK